MDFKIGSDGIMRFWDRICVLDVSELKKMLFEGSHKSNLKIHPIATKIYQDLKRIFWWPNMKNDVVKCVYYFLVCQKSKIKHQKPSRLMQHLSIPDLE